MKNESFQNLYLNDNQLMKRTNKINPTFVEQMRILNVTSYRTKELVPAYGLYKHCEHLGTVLMGLNQGSTVDKSYM